MSLVSLFWGNDGGTDIHLLPGLASPELKRLLRAGDLNATTNEVEENQLSSMTGLTVAFAAQLVAPASQGITFSTTTGEVVVDTPAMKGRSFLITATATQGTATATASVRVSVHGAINKVWLTPARLTVRKGAKNMRLSVLAEFDDGVIGDITNWAPFEKPGGPSDHTYVHAKGSDDRAIAWEAQNSPAGGAAVMTVDRDTGVLSASTDAGTATITVRIPGGKSATATGKCDKPWSTPVNLTHLSGPGAKEVNFVPNILFLPDGFLDTEIDAYKALVRFVVGRLSTRNRTRPFAALTGRINYFMGWVPSPDPGISVLNELYRSTERKDKPSERHGVEMPSKVRRAPARWQLDDLINAIGLPTPTGDPDGIVLDDARVNIWRGLYGTDITKPRVQPLFAKWLDRNDRALLNERDTAFHMAFGDRPSLDGTTTDRGIGINPRRLHADDFNAFLDALRGPTGGVLPPLWTSGKDNALVVILCRTTRHGGLNAGRSVPGPKPGHTLGVSLGGNAVHQVQPNAGGGFDLIPDPIPTEPHFRVWLTVAHELAHSWTLGDEYGGTSTTATADRLADVAKRANVQARATLLNADGDLTTDRLKWGTWPRIAKAGILAINPTASGGKLTVTLTDGKAAGFKPKDIVRLRTRPLPVAAAPSTRCKVESVTGDQVVIVPLFAAAVNPAAFPAGSILMAPVRKKDSNPDADLYGAELTLADENVLLRITSTFNPLNANPMAGEGKAPNDIGARPCPNVELAVPTAATNFPDRKAPNPPIFSSWTIGIYENGAGFNCGIYRPTGICLMNESAHTEPKTNDLTLYDFCLICRYAIVDAVDPTLHGEVEQDFRGRYGVLGAVP